MRARTKIQLAIVGGSFGLHLVGWACVGLFSTERKHDIVAIALAESKKKEPKKEDKPPPPPPPPPAPPPKQAAKVAAPVAKAAEPPPQEAPAPASDAPSSEMSGFADLGLSMSGGNGMAIPAGGGGGGGARPAQPAPAATQRKTLAPAKTDECEGDLVKAKLEHQVQPAYTQEGRQANVEGVVQLEITIDATGRVVSVRVVKGLGHGLDEAAVAAAKQWTFTPATRCGKPVPTTLKPKVRFSLS